uniref:Rho GTPase activating protein 30 n=1 Tax=Podarcis muralis TaxID=64176 RepID=A0A670JRU6_PODMU
MPGLLRPQQAAFQGDLAICQEAPPFPRLTLNPFPVPQVLKSCTEFVEQHGIVDGIYRLSGVSSNIQKLRLEFDNDRGSPDLNKDLYLQDIHCVSSLCKAYFRELPNPLLTYQLYDKFADAVAIQMEEGRLEKIKDVLKELPVPHYRTLEFLMKHLVHMASFSSETNMHVRNLAIVWAPNLLRSKDIESCGFNGTAAFMEVRVQSIVVEFILTHVDQIFNNVPLSGSRESLRKSLLLASSPVTIGDDKYSFSCNIPAALNQGDGPPQMRPYHTIIELTDNKRKGSLKAKKWKSIFNLGRSSHDAKRKLNKSEDKDDKMGKMRLRPAKSMDSLSSMPCASDGSFDGPASLDNSFLLSESDEYTERPKAEEAQGESEGEATAKSEPTTPKASRSSLVGVAPQGRSPKTGRNRAEKCAGVHISGPFSVTVPFHITSNLSLSRLTRGLECPALSHCALEKDPSETSEAGVYASPLLESGKRGLSDSEENQMSLEVQDSFSFLDSQDAWLGESMDGDQPRKSTSIVPDFAGSGVDSSPLTEDDMSSGFMNEMIGGGMQLEMFSAVSPLDYLSIEECMNEHSEEEDDQYYLAVGCSDGDEVSKEVDSEEVYLSAFDDLSPLTSPMLAPSLEPDAPPERAPPGGSSPDNSNGSEASSLGAPSLQGCPESPPQTPPHSMPVKSSDALKHDLSDGSVSMRLTSHAIRVQQAKSFPVVPPKPQFAKIPPALMPISPTKEASLMWCSPPVPEKNCRNGIKEGPSEGSLRRWASWRNGNSMSFDEAVALAKERHVGQAPMRRMQTYCFGDVEGLYGPPRTEKPPPNPKPALKPLGQWPLRPLSCAGTAADAFVPGKPLLAPALPDIIPEGQLSPSLEALSLPQDLPPRRKLSLTKAGRRASNSEEVLLAAQQERR